MTDTDKIKQVIENAIADGRLSYQESEMIKMVIYKNQKMTRENAMLWRELQMKIVTAEILLDGKQ